MATIKDLLAEVVRKIETLRTADADLRHSAEELGKAQKGRMKNGSKRYQLGGKVVILTHHPNANPGKNWNVSLEDVEVVN